MSILSSAIAFIPPWLQINKIDDSKINNLFNTMPTYNYAEVLRVQNTYPQLSIAKFSIIKSKPVFILIDRKKFEFTMSLPTLSFNDCWYDEYNNIEMYSKPKYFLEYNTNIGDIYVFANNNTTVHELLTQCVTYTLFTHGL